SDCSILFHSPNSPHSTTNSQPFPFSTPPKSFFCNIYAPPRQSVANKRLTVKLIPLDATFTRNRGVGSSYWKTFRPRRCKCRTEEREGAKRKGGPKPALQREKR